MIQKEYGVIGLIPMFMGGRW